MSDDLVKRLELPWPADDSGAEVTLPIWVLELLAEAKDRIETLTDTVAKDAKAHENEIAVWSENYAALEHKIAALTAGLNETSTIALEQSERAEVASAKLARGVRILAAIDAVPASQIADEALERAAERVRRYLKEQRLPMKDRSPGAHLGIADAIRAMKGTKE